MKEPCIDIEEAVVSIDAMGTQHDIAELIVGNKGHYLLALKENQRSLYEDVECAFKVNKGIDVHEDVDAGHGRIETRKCSILPAKDFLMEDTLADWEGLSTIIKIESRREMSDKTTYDVRYYISDESETKASYYASLIRGHWSIENQLHWHLDVTFKEDACRARKGFASQNLSVLRKVALHIVSGQNIVTGLWFVKSLRKFNRQGHNYGFGDSKVSFIFLPHKFFLHFF